MTESEYPTYTNAAKTGNKGVRMVEEIVSDQFGWILRPQDGQKDLGIDAHIELIGSNGEAFGKLIAAQIKCGKSFFKTSNIDGYVFYGELKHLNYYLNYSIPVIIILCDPEENVCWWSEVDPLETDRTKTGWQITIPFNQRFDLHAQKMLIDLAGPITNYHEELEHYWKSNKMLTMPAKNMDIVVAREDIEKQDTSRVLAILERFKSSKKITRTNKERLSMSVYGYEQDKRELFEIPEVRTWFSQICEEFPYWFYFLNTEISTLQLILFCILPYTIITRDDQKLKQKVEVDLSFVGPFLQRNFAGLNEMCESVGASEDEIFRISQKISKIIIPEFNYPRG